MEIHSTLDHQRVMRALTGQRLGRRLISLATTGSTNDVLRDLAALGEPHGTAVFADEQTAGRGRAGKARWITPAGTSIALSVLLRPHLPPSQMGWLSLLAGVAAADALREVATVPAMLKWPNDVLIRGRKVGGILLESKVSGVRIDHAIIGIGLNVNVPAAALGPMPEMALPPTSVMDEGDTAVSREDLLVALLQHMEREYVALPGGAPSLRARYRALLEMMGQPVRVLSDGPPLDAVAEDVAEDGGLVLRLPSGERRTVLAGEVSVRGQGPGVREQGMRP